MTMIVLGEEPMCHCGPALYVLFFTASKKEIIFRYSKEASCG